MKIKRISYIWVLRAQLKGMFKLHKKDEQNNLLYAEGWTSDEVMGIARIEA